MRMNLIMSRGYRLSAAAWIAAASLLLMALSGCQAMAGSPPPEEEEEREISTSVGVLTIAPADIDNVLLISSKAEAMSEVAVIPKAAGTVAEVYVQVGDRVSEGDVLFLIDDTNYKIAVTQARNGISQAQAGLAAARANYNMAQSGSTESTLNQLRTAVTTSEMNYNNALDGLERIKRLYEIGSVAKVEVTNAEHNVELLKKQLDSAIESLNITENQIKGIGIDAALANVNQAEAAVKSAQAALENATNALEDTKVKAGISGIIGSSSVKKGATVAQSPVMSIVDMDTVQLSLSVPDSAVNRISEGAEAFITVSAVSDKPMKGVVANISPVAGANMLYPVKIYIDNPDFAIKPGMFASVRLILETKSGVVSVPLNAVIEKSGEKYVFIAGEDATAVKRPVETGIKNETVIEITSGLSVGDRVIVTGQTYLADGSRIEIV